MIVDLSILVRKAAIDEVFNNEKMASFGHLGTHFDVMNKTFPIDFAIREGIAVDVRNVSGRDIDVCDVDLSIIKPGVFVAFCTGFIERVNYGTKEYFKAHPQLSDDLVDALLERKVAIIGIDCAGVRRGAEHTPKDQYCVDNGVFVVENLCNLEKVIGADKITMYTFPINFDEMSGLPCRVMCEI